MSRTGSMVLPDDMIDDFHDGFAQLRRDFDVPGEHPLDVLAAADAAAATFAPAEQNGLGQIDRGPVDATRQVAPTAHGCGKLSEGRIDLIGDLTAVRDSKRCLDHVPISEAPRHL
jgi:hypothetical protein